MNRNEEECLICGEPTPVCSCEEALPVCEDCALTELPRAMAHAILADDAPGCSFGRLEAALIQVEKNYWQAAAYHLHHGTDEDHDGDDDCEHDVPPRPSLQPSVN